MGRIFEKRKHKMFARYAKMAKAFTRIGKEIAIACKQGTPDPEHNPRLRAVIQNAKALNMPKSNIDSAIARAKSKDASNFEEVTYEGYGPHGIAIVIETATDNPTRTVANIRMHFNRGGGSLGKTGSLDFLFERMGVFKIARPANVNLEELELELIDGGLQEIAEAEDGIYIYSGFTDFGAMQKALEDKKLEVISSDKQRFPTNTTELTDSQSREVMHLIEMIEEDDDVQVVYHNMKETD
ncbi:MAG: YebC/PmpR family DNA-binding transcriptional regulator [Bacteroidia bacterium]|nr:YebC/PmpR family DNA-binding transcriptional regulator [Bacteroidia bacterium]